MMLPPGEAIRHLFARAVVLGERWHSGEAYDPLCARTAQDPYPSYAAIRERHPVHRSRLLHAWLVTRYTDVDLILRDHDRFANDPRKAALSRRQRRLLPPQEELTMLTLDRPDHTRLRALVNNAFAKKRIHALEPRIRAVMGSLLDASDPGGFDLVEAVAKPLPIMVIAEMLGIPAQDRARFEVWSSQRARLLEPTITMRERRTGVSASHAFDAYLRTIIAARRTEPRDDILSALVQAQHEGEHLTERELLNMVRLLLVGGTETSSNLISNGMLALLHHPEQLERLRADPGRIPGAVEELLRYDAPVQCTFRRVLVDGEISGTRVRARETLALVLGAANRDPDAYPQPDKLDVSRNGRPHLSLGRGIHHCLGAVLARLEARIAFEMLLERFSSIALLGPEPRFHCNVVLRSLRALPLRCTRAGLRPW